MLVAFLQGQSGQQGCSTLQTEVSICLELLLRKVQYATIQDTSWPLKRAQTTASHYDLVHVSER